MNVKNPFEIPSNQFTLNASEDVCIRRFVQADENGMCKHATSDSDPIVGVTYMSDFKESQPVAIVGGGIALVEAGAAITAGSFVTAGSDGKAATGGSTYIALTSADEGSLVTVKLG